MKSLLLACLPLTFLLPAAAQQTPPTLLPPPVAAPGDPAAAPLGPFKDQMERRSYGLGSFLGEREKKTALNNPDQAPVNPDEVLAGLSAGLKGEKSLDYAGGLAMAAQIKRSGLDIDPAVLAEAVRTALENKPSKVQPAELQGIMQEIQTEIQGRMQAKAAAEAEKNLGVAMAWLAENAQKEGVKSTPSGLQYTMDAHGEGRTPGPGDVVTIHLTGTTTDGAEFDRTPEGTPGRRALPALTKGLQEGLQLMKVGGKARFWVPPALGYGEAPRGPGLKANSVLVYTIELIAAEEPPAPPPTAATGPDGQPLPQVKREPITAVTPPVSVEIPADGGAPKIKVEGQPETPPAAPPAPPSLPAPANK